MSGLPVFVLSILCVAPRAAGYSPGDALGNAPGDETGKGKISQVWVLNATRKCKRSHPSGSLLLLGVRAIAFPFLLVLLKAAACLVLE